MAVPNLVLELVERFQRNEAAYHSGLYNETQVRRYVFLLHVALDIDCLLVLWVFGKISIHRNCAFIFLFPFRILHSHFRILCTLLERQITATDRQIDQLVYALYGLMEAEIELIEKT